jgi:hypothetical protein
MLQAGRSWVWDPIRWTNFKSSSTVLSIGNIVGISALMHMDNTLKRTNVEFNKNTKQKIIKINSGYFWVPPHISQYENKHTGCGKLTTFLHIAIALAKRKLACRTLYVFNYWVMHPVACVSINIYIATSVRNKCWCSFYCALLTLYVSAPIGGHLQAVL